jgi:urea transport system substrate-binding protein
VPVEEVVNDLIEAHAIDAIVGMHISAIRQRLSKVVQQRVPYIYTPLYEGGENTPGIFAIGETPQEQLGPAMETLQKQFRPKRWALIGNDYVWPHTSHSYAKIKLKELSAGLSYERYLPFGVRNMAHFVDEIAHSGAEAVLISLVGQDAVTFNRAFGAAGLDEKMIRLSCCIEENGLLACGSRNLKRFFSSASYFGTLKTETNCAFKESYYGLHGDKAPVLNVIGQSTYEGVHFLSALMENKSGDWRERSAAPGMDFRYKSVKRNSGPKPAVERAPIYLARADGIMFEVIRQI